MSVLSMYHDVLDAPFWVRKVITYILFINLCALAYGVCIKDKVQRVRANKNEITLLRQHWMKLKSDIEKEEAIQQNILILKKQFKTALAQMAKPTNTIDAIMNVAKKEHVHIKKIQSDHRLSSMMLQTSFIHVWGDGEVRAILRLIKQMMQCNENMTVSEVDMKKKSGELDHQIRVHAVFTVHQKKTATPSPVFVSPRKQSTGMLENFSLQQFCVQGIVRSKRGDMVMISTPDSRLYAMKVGQLIGKDKVKIVAINDDDIRLLDDVIQPSFEKYTTLLSVGNCL